MVISHFVAVLYVLHWRGYKYKGCTPLPRNLFTVVDANTKVVCCRSDLKVPRSNLRTSDFICKKKKRYILWQGIYFEEEMLLVKNRSEYIFP